MASDVSVNMGWGNGLSPIQHQAFTWTNVCLPPSVPLGINWCKIWIKITNVSFNKMHLQLSSVKWWSFCWGLSVQLFPKLNRKLTVHRPWDYFYFSLQWHHNEDDGVSNHQPSIVYSGIYSGADQRKHQSSASLAFVQWIHQWPQRTSNVENVSIWWRHHVV